MNSKRCLRMLTLLVTALAAAIPLQAQIPSGGTITISCSSQAAAGSSVPCSVTLSLTGGVTANNLTFGVTVSPNGGAPALTSGALTFNDSIGGGFPAAAGTDGIAVLWSGISPALSGSRNIGTVNFTMPAAATTGQTYSVSFTSVSASMGNSLLNIMTGSPSAVSVPAPTPLSITDPSSLPNGVLGSAYASTWFSATGGTGTYTWTASGLPGGLSMSSEGQLSGTPTQSGTFNPGFTVTDSSFHTATVNISLLIGAASSSCIYTLTPAAVGIPQAGGVASIGVAVASGCLWTVSVSSGAISWISPSGNTTGMGNGTVTIQVSANAGSGRTGTLTIGGATYTVYQTGYTVIPVGSLPQFATGAGWDTTITIVNLWPTSEQIRVRFFDDSGNPLELPVTFPQTSTATQTVSSVARQLGPGAELIIKTNSASAPTSTSGWVQLLSNGKTDASCIFGFASSGGVQEAVVLKEDRSPSAFLLSFDNTVGLKTGVALANISDQSVTIPVILRDSLGTQLGTALPIDIAAHGHTQFMLGERYPVTDDQMGTAEFGVPSGAQIAVLGIRATPTGAITSVPVVAR